MKENISTAQLAPSLQARWRLGGQRTLGVRSVLDGWSERHPSLHYTALVAAVAALYFCSAKLGLTMASVAEQVTAVWPPTGFALAAVLLFGYRVWPGILLGAFLANATANEPVFTACGIALGNTLGTMTGAYLLHRILGFRNSLDRLKDVLGLVVLAAGAGAAVSGTLGAANLCLGGIQPWAAYGRAWWTWFLGDAVGVLVLTPALLVWTSRTQSRWEPRLLPEAVSLFVILVTVSLVVFCARQIPTIGSQALEYLVFPIVIWGALRFGVTGATTATLIISCIAISGTVNGFGPFAMDQADQKLTLLQLLMAVVAVTALLLGAAVTERKITERRAAADYAVIQTLGASGTLREAAPQILRAICERLGWDFGALWMVDEERPVLRCFEVWHRSSPICIELATVSRKNTFASGVGMAGHIWASGEAVSIADVATDADLPCGGFAARVGLHGALGFPIISGAQVLGVIELFSHDIQQPDEDLLDMMVAIGSQVGQFVERQRVDEARQDSEVRLRQALGAGRMGVWDWNIRTGAVTWSDSLEAIHGLAPGTFGGTLEAFQELIHPGDREYVLREISQAVEQRTNYEIEFRTVWPDQSVHWMAGKGRVVGDEAGECSRMIGVGMDITIHKDLEEQLRQSQKMEAIGRLAGEVAHDFNNLLTVMLGETCHLLDQVSPADPMHESLTAINQSVERAGSLTHRLLAFSRKHVFSAVVLDLDGVVASMYRMLRRLVGTNIELLTVLRAEPGLVRMDPSQIEQVFMNLIVNAVDVMPDGGKITIETQNVVLDVSYTRHRPGLEAGRYVMLGVSDTGCGMDRETMSHIFEPFFTTKPPSGGTGLGLAMVYGIIQQSGGHIAVYSEPGQGTTFKVYLPRVAREEDVAQPQRTPAAQTGGWETILLVEDETLVRSIVQRALSMHGYAVLEAFHGDEALRTCEQHEGPIHILLTDVVMPGMTGLQLAERAARTRPDMKILFMSGYTDAALVHQGKLTTSTAFLGKPFTGEALATKVRQVLDAE
jgi:PAS domain S-box-containing protein